MCNLFIYFLKYIFLPGRPHHTRDCWKTKGWHGKSSGSHKAGSNVYHAALLQEVWEPTHVLFCAGSHNKNSSIRHLKYLLIKHNKLVPWECQHSLNSFFCTSQPLSPSNLISNNIHQQLLYSPNMYWKAWKVPKKFINWKVSKKKKDSKKCF